MSLLEGPREGLFLMNEVPLYRTIVTTNSALQIDPSSFEVPAKHCLANTNNGRHFVKISGLDVLARPGCCGTYRENP